MSNKFFVLILSMMFYSNGYCFDPIKVAEENPQWVLCGASLVISSVFADNMAPGLIGCAISVGGKYYYDNEQKNKKLSDEDMKLVSQKITDAHAEYLLKDEIRYDTYKQVVRGAISKQFKEYEKRLERYKKDSVRLNERLDHFSNSIFVDGDRNQKDLSDAIKKNFVEELFDNVK